MLVARFAGLEALNAKTLKHEGFTGDSEHDVEISPPTDSRSLPSSRENFGRFVLPR